ncbi:NaeI family type II restriction endonuclease [Actinoplanes sp. NPDC051861]|uniref:NaeI family type II restriction endonuclease n=1 Tax=Actinoplanes sp. NPDC051861 TaxID=3155170 RepID=UPI003441BCA9
MGETEEINSLAAFLQKCQQDAGLSVRTLRTLLDPERLKARHVPSHAVLQRKLNGALSAAEKQLIDEIVRVCTPPAELGRALARAERLRQAAISGTTPADRGRDEVARLRRELNRVKGNLDIAKDDLLAETRRRADAETRLHATARDHSATGTDQAEVARLREAVRRAEAERDEALRELAALRRERAATSEHRSEPARPTPATSTGGADPELDKLAEALRQMDPDGVRLAAVLRRSLDQLYDGRNTGRFDWRQLGKTEKTHLGTLVEIELHREFGLADGQRSDFALNGIEFDLKFSVRDGGWMIARGDPRLLLLVTGNDTESNVSAALVRVRDGLLHDRGNRDGSASLSAEGRAALRWLHRRVPMTENLLAHLTAGDRAAILDLRPGQRRVTEFFRQVLERPVSRAVVETLAMQENAAKRVRYARDLLRREGIVILGGRNGAHRGIAAELGLTLDRSDSWMSVRVVPADEHEPDVRSAEIDGRRWRLAGPDDPIIEGPGT